MPEFKGYFLLLLFSQIVMAKEGKRGKKEKKEKGVDHRLEVYL